MPKMEERNLCVCFTGHRPEKLSGTESEIKEELEKEIHRAIADGFSAFLTGMARGVDIWAAEIVLRLRETGFAVKLICASPYEGFERTWNADWRKSYESLLSAADFVYFISQKYSRSCFRIRNEWMVNHSARVIAVFNGSKGGTKNTIDYARRKGVSVVTIRG